jgi:hypothetical protein
VQERAVFSIQIAQKRLQDCFTEYCRYAKTVIQALFGRTPSLPSRCGWAKTLRGLGCSKEALKDICDLPVS